MSSLNLLDKQLVLSLNRNWQPIGHLSVRRALTCIFSEADDEKAALPLDIEMGVDENGDDVLVYANPTKLEDWLMLPIRDQDLFVHSAHQQVRVPTVIVSVQYDRMPMRKPRFGRSGVAARDNWECGYTGKKLTRATMSIDHILPRSRGGKDTWENTISCDKAINQMKGDRLPHEAGLTLLRKPKAPPSLPVSAMITEAGHPSWKPFLL